MTIEIVHMSLMKPPTRDTTYEAKLFELPMNRWHTWEPRSVTSTPPDTSTGSL